jgi:mono/diheme cytochrome c family protein
MNNRWFRIAMVIFPVLTLLFFLYMTFSHSAYESPGRITYFQSCASCHGDHGEGIALLVPPLHEADYLYENFDKLPCMIRNGMNDTIIVNGKMYYQPMYPINLNDVEIANLMNFMQDTFMRERKDRAAIRTQWVKSQSDSCK